MPGIRHSQILFATAIKTRDFTRSVRLTGVDQTINRIQFVFAFLFKFSNKGEVSTTDVTCTRKEKAEGRRTLVAVVVSTSLSKKLLLQFIYQRFEACRNETKESFCIVLSLSACL